MKNKKKCRESKAPVVKSSHIQNLQLLSKTLILFLQRCFAKTDLVESNEVRQTFEEFISLLGIILENGGNLWECFSLLSILFKKFFLITKKKKKKEIFKMELGYSVSMDFILLNTFVSSDNHLKDLVLSD